MLAEADAQALAEARRAYLAGDYRGAAERNDLVARSADPLAAALGVRFSGLCAFRSGDHEQALARFDEAGRRARGLGCVELELLVENHRGAALRRAGHLGSALTCFLEAEARARRGGRFQIQARLLGNLGALYDELGQRSRADDCYARFEVLFELEGRGHRLANARGLAGRAALLRGDFDGARWRFEEQRAYGEAEDEPRVVIDADSALAHLALEEAKAAPAAGRETCLAVAASHLEHALGHPAAARHGHRKVRLHLLHAEWSTLRGDWIGAALELDATAELAARIGPSSEAELSHLRARVARKLGLRAEALEHLRTSLTRRRALYGPAAAVPGDLGAPRIQELGDFKRELEGELRALPTDPVDRQPGVPLDEGPPLWRWRREAEEAARHLWRQVLLPDDFDRLLPASRADLLQSEVAYQGPVDDLGRCVHLLAVVVEREVGERVVARVKAAIRGRSGLSELLRRVRGGTLGLGDQGNLLRFLLSGTPPRDPVEGACSAVAADLPGLAVIARAFEPVGLSSGGTVRLTRVRNAVAHGSGEGMPRLTVDALKRHLSVGAPSVLAALARLPLPPRR